MEGKRSKDDPERKKSHEDGTFVISFRKIAHSLARMLKDLSDVQMGEKLGSGANGAVSLPLSLFLSILTDRCSKEFSMVNLWLSKCWNRARSTMAAIGHS